MPSALGLVGWRGRRWRKSRRRAAQDRRATTRVVSEFLVEQLDAPKQPADISASLRHDIVTYTMLGIRQTTLEYATPRVRGSVSAAEAGAPFAPRRADARAP